MNVMQIAHKAPARVAAGASVADAIRLMRDRGVGSLMVVEDSHLEGTFTERDVLDRVVLPRRDVERTKVRDVMTTPVWTVRADQSIDDAIRIMEGHGVRRLPVVRDGTLVGVVSLRYVLRDKIDSLDQNADALCALLSADGIGGG